MPLKIGTIDERHSEPRDLRLYPRWDLIFLLHLVHLGHRLRPVLLWVVYCFRFAFGSVLLARDYHVRSTCSLGHMMRLLNHLELRRFGKTARVMVGGADYFILKY